MHQHTRVQIRIAGGVLALVARARGQRDYDYAPAIASGFPGYLLIRYLGALHSAAAHHNIALLDIDAGDEATARLAIKQAMAINPFPETIELANALDSERAN